MVAVEAYSYPDRGNRRVGIALAPRSPFTTRPVSAMPTPSALSYSVGTAPLRFEQIARPERRRAHPYALSFELEHEPEP